ncbi:MAG: aldose 1-epimerase [Sphingomicrobium sp.]
MPPEQCVELIQGDLRLELSPSIGGCISAFQWIGKGGPVPILRQPAQPLQQVLEAACFPLVPYVNRIRGGCFSFHGREIRIAPNMPGDPSPLHGQGWLNGWTVEDHSAAGAVLAFAHQPGEWPWRYEARQQFALDPAGLSVTLRCRNTGDQPMPCGLGLHPYFHCGPATRLDTRVTDVWTIDEHVLPVTKVPVEGRFDLRHRLVCGQDLDHGFGGWSGEARMSDPDWPFALSLSATDARFFQLYSPATGGIFVAEPVSHANAALNAPESQWPELGMRVLAPDETMQLTMRLAVAARDIDRAG